MKKSFSVVVMAVMVVAVAVFFGASMASALTISPIPVTIEQGSTGKTSFAFSDPGKQYKVSIIKNYDTKSAVVVKELPATSTDDLNFITFNPAGIGIDTSKLGKTDYRIVLEEIPSVKEFKEVRFIKISSIPIVVE